MREQCIAVSLILTLLFLPAKAEGPRKKINNINPVKDKTVPSKDTAPAVADSVRMEAPEQTLPDFDHWQDKHHPRKSRYDYLMQMIKPIIPHAIHDPPPPPEDPNIEVVKGVLNTTKDIYDKMKDTNNTKQKTDLKGVAAKARRLLAVAQSNYGYKSFGRPHIRDADRNALLKEFGAALKGPEVKTKHKSKAPFARLGEDGFDDVDHQIMAMEMKRLAFTVKQYLETRKQETEEFTRMGMPLDAPFFKAKDDTDHALAQITLMMAKLHRAILRNHHHILMLIGNFAGNAASTPFDDDTTEDVEE